MFDKPIRAHTGWGYALSGHPFRARPDDSAPKPKVDQLSSALSPRERTASIGAVTLGALARAEAGTGVGEHARELIAVAGALLDTLSPEERAVFVLREVLEYSYAEIALVPRQRPVRCHPPNPALGP